LRELIVIIYKVENDVEKFSIALPMNDSIWEANTLVFNGSSKKGSWKDIDFFLQDKRLEIPNCIYIAPGAIAFDEAAADSLIDILEMSGELLPVTIDGKAYFLHNITEVVGALDEEKTSWDIIDGVKIDILKYCFLPNRLSESSLFKIPNLNSIDIFAYSHGKDLSDEFVFRYNQANLKGLKFIQVFSA